MRSKQEIREEYVRFRKSLTNQELDQRSLKISQQLLTLDIWDYEYYHIFLPIAGRKEINTEYILPLLQGKDKKIVLSKSNFKDNTMEHFLLLDDTVIRPNKYGIPEPQGGIPIDPSILDVVFVPLLVCDTKGNRLGYGGGFYDRFLSKCRSNCKKIGLSAFLPLNNTLPQNPHDISLNISVTPYESYFYNHIK